MKTLHSERTTERIASLYEPNYAGYVACAQALLGGGGALLRTLPPPPLLPLGEPARRLRDTLQPIR